jgi:hypothetical protein
MIDRVVDCKTADVMKCFVGLCDDGLSRKVG